jgi:hypothetical protein
MERLANNPAMTATMRKDGTGLLREKVYFAMTLYAVTFAVIAVPSALLGYFLYQMTGYFVSNRSRRILVVLLYGLGTIAFPYAQTFNGRQISAVLTIVVFYILLRIKYHEISPHYLWIVGLLMGVVVITDYPSIFILAALFFYAWSITRKWWGLVPLVLAGIPPVALMVCYNLTTFETILPAGYKYSALYQDLHSQGLISITHPRLEAIYGLTFSPFRGLFFSSPALLLVIPGFVIWYRRRSFRAEWWVCLSAVLSSFLFYSSSVMWWGGFAVGPAYLAAMIPYVVIPIVFFLDVCHPRPWIWLLSVALTAVSIALIWAQTIAGQSFPDMTPNPLLDLAIPSLLAGDIARNLGMTLALRGPLSLVPLLLAVLVLLGLIIRLCRLSLTYETAQ